jgi:hypothetical protein
MDNLSWAIVLLTICSSVLAGAFGVASEFDNRNRAVLKKQLANRWGWKYGKTRRDIISEQLPPSSAVFSVRGANFIQWNMGSAINCIEGRKAGLNFGCCDISPLRGLCDIGPLLGTTLMFIRHNGLPLFRLSSKFDGFVRDNREVYSPEFRKQYSLDGRDDPEVRSLFTEELQSFLTAGDPWNINVCSDWLVADQGRLLPVEQLETVIDSLCKLAIYLRVFP